MGLGGWVRVRASDSRQGCTASAASSETCSSLSVRTWVRVRVRTWVRVRVRGFGLEGSG